MKKNHFLYSGTIISIIAIAIFNMGNAGGPPAGFTGSPADGKTCGSNGGCHSGNTIISQTGWITSDIPTTGYTPGDTFSITATVTQNGITKFGFQLSPQSPTGTKLGTLVANANTKLAGGSGKYIEQISLSTSGAGTKSWTFDWIAPVAGTGDVTFYASFNATNSNGGTGGDQVYVSSLTVQEEDSLTEIAETNFSDDFKIFPNPNKGFFTIDFSGPNLIQNSQILLFNILGEQIYQSSLQNNRLPFSIDISKHGSGIYYLRIITDKESVNRTIIVK